MTWATDTIVKTWADPVINTVYEFPHDNWGAQDLAVSFIDDDGAEIPLELGVDYAVSPTGRSVDGHDITLLATVPTDVASLKVRRHTRTRQQAPAPTGAEGVVDSVDRAIAIAAELRFDLGVTAALARENRDLLASLVITGGDVDASVLDIWTRVGVLEALWPEDTIMTLNAVQTATNKTLTAPVLTSAVLNAAVGGSAVLTDGTLAAASHDTLPSSQSVVDYVAAQGFSVGYQPIAEHDFASDGATFAVTDIREADFEFELEGLTATTFTVSFSTNGGTSWGAALTLASSISGHNGIGWVRGMTLADRKTLVGMTSGPTDSAAASVFRIQPSAQAENAIRFGGIEAGKVRLRRVAGNVALNDPFWGETVLLIQGGFSENQGFVGEPAIRDLSQSAATVTSSGGHGNASVGVITSSSLEIGPDEGGVKGAIYWDHSTDLDPGAGPFTWEYADNMPALPASRVSTFSAWGTSKSYFLFVDPNGDVGMVYRTSPGGADNTITFAAGLTANTEHRVAFILDGLGVLRCNVNGVYVGSPVPLVGAITPYAGNFTHFGERADGAMDLTTFANRLRMTRAARTDFTETGLFLAR